MHSGSDSGSKPNEKQKVWQKAHAEAVERGEDFYLDPETGYSVWTELFLRKRGECCNSGCRHCPYRKEV